MTFLAPIAGIIGAAVAAPLLVLLYFLKLRRRPLRVSSTMLWSRAVEDLQVNAPFRWLRPSVLLFLQLLALALLALALARPALESGGAPAERIIILLDRSASMAASADPENPDAGTRLESARRQAIELIDGLGSSGALGGVDGAEVMVITFAGAASAATNFTTDRGLLRSALESVEQTDQPGMLDRALRLVQAQLAGGSEQDAETRARIVLFSDGVYDAADRDIRSAGAADVRFVRTGPAPEAGRDNLGIVAASARRDYDDPAVLRVFVRIQNAGPNPIETLLSVRHAGEPVEGQTVSIPGADADGSGEGSATFRFDAPQAGLLRLSIPRPDDLPADNDAALHVDSARAVRIVVVSPDGRDAASNFAIQALMQALEVITDSAPRLVSGVQYESLAAQPGAFEQVDLVIFDQVAPETVPPVPSLSFGARLPVRGMLVEPAPEEAPTVRFVNWRRTHPALRNVNLDPVLVRAPLTITIPDEAAGRPDRDDEPASSNARPLVEAEPIAWGPDGPLILELRERTLRRILVAFPIVRSNWSLEPGFIVFLANVIDTLSVGGQQSAARAYTTGSPISVRTATGAETVRVEGPRSLSIDVDPDDPRVNLGLLPLVGVYSVAGAVEDDSVLPVNLFDPVESAIATAESVDISGQRAEAGALSDAAPREIWHWFIIAALILLTLEWILYAWRMRV